MASSHTKGAWPNFNRLLKLKHWNDCYVYDFFFYFYYCGTVCNSKVCTVLYFYLYIYLKKMENYIYFLMFNKTDSSLYFLTLEKVAVSLPTKCLRNPTSGSVLIGDYRYGPASFVRDEAINPILSLVVGGKYIFIYQ